MRLGADHVGALDRFVLVRVGETLLLDAGHVEHVGLGQNGLQLGVLGLRDAGCLDLLDDLRGHAQDLGRDVVQPDVEEGQQARQRMDGAAILQVAQHGDGQAVDLAQLLADGEQVEQRLGGVLADAVAGVDDRLAGVLGRQRGRAGLRVAQHDHIGVAFQRADRVGQRLALGHRGVAHLVDRDHAAAQPLHGRGERGRGAGRRLVEQVGQDLALEQVEGAHAAHHLLHLVGHAEDVFQIGAAELLHREDVLAVERCILLVAERQVRA